MITFLKYFFAISTRKLSADAFEPTEDTYICKCNACTTDVNVIMFYSDYQVTKFSYVYVSYSENPFPTYTFIHSTGTVHYNQKQAYSCLIHVHLSVLCNKFMCTFGESRRHVPLRFCCTHGN